MDNSLDKNSNYFPALTGIRAIAAFFVFFHHFNPFPKSLKYYYNYFNELHIGVTIFFVLSGFLIATRYYGSSITGKFNFINYFQNRFARIYPIYFILTTITFIYILKSGRFEDYGIGKQFILYFSNITFLKGFFNDLKFTLIAQGWSLTVEEVFYISAPFIFILIHKNKKSVFILPICITLFGVLLVLLFSNFKFFGLFEDLRFMFIYTFFGRSFEFFIGIILALELSKKGKVNISKPYSLTFIGASGILISILFLSLLKGELKSGLRHPEGIFINHLILPLFIALLFWGLIKEKSFLQKILSTKLFIILGRSSYIFYLIHMGVFEKTIKEYITTNLLFLFILLNILSVLLFYLIEEPLNKKIRNIKVNIKKISMVEMLSKK